MSQTLRSGRRCRRDLIALGVLLGLTAIVAWNRFVYDAWLARHDLLTYFLPWYSYLGDRLAHFQIPGWNPYLFSGAPFAGDPESGWMYLPAMLFFPFLSAAAAFKAMVLLQLLTGGLATYALARVLGMGAVAALVGAVLYEFGPFLYQNTYCCTVRAQVATWIPLSLLGVELALRARSWPGRVAAWFVTGLAISQMFAGWMGQGVLDALLLLAAYIGYRTLISPPGSGWRWPARLGQCLLTGGVTLGLGVALGAAGILPRLALNQVSSLAGGDYSSAPGASDSTPYTVVTLLWHIFGDGYSHQAVALGGTALVLAMLAPLIAGRRFAVPYFFGLTVVVYVLTLRWSPVHWLFYQIPYFKPLQEHSPHQINAIVMIGPSMLAAATVAALPRWRGALRRLWVVFLPVLIVIGVALVLDHEGKHILAPPIIAALVVTGLLALTVLVPRSTKLPAGLHRLIRLVPVLILVVAFVQPTGENIVESITGHAVDPAWLAQWRPSPQTTQGIAVNLATTDPGGAGEFLQRQQAIDGPFRYVGYGGIGVKTPGRSWGEYPTARLLPEVQALLVNGRPMRLGLQEIQGYNPFQLQNYVAYMAALNGRKQNYHYANLLPGGVQSPLLNLLNVRYLILDAKLPADRRDVVALKQGRHEVFRDASVVVYENPAALPRAWIVHETRTATPAAALAALAAGKTDPRQIAFVSGPAPPAAADPPNSQESADITGYQPDRITIGTTTAAAGLLVVSEIYDSGWHATIDGHAAPLLRTDGALRGIPIPTGTHTVVLTYAPRSLEIGLWISGFAALAMLASFAAAAWTWRRGVVAPSIQVTIFSSLE